MEIIALLLALWISIFGFSIILGQHQRFARWTGRALRGVVAFFWRRFVALCRWVWRHYWQMIVGYAAGILTALYMTGYFR